MPSESKTDHVRKRCDCSKWKECSHPWYVDYQEGKRRYRPNLDKLIDRHPVDFVEAKKEARRAIDAWLDGKSAADLLAADRPTLATLLEAYRKRPDASASELYQVKPITTTKVNGRPFGEWHADEITREMIETYRSQRKRIAANRNLALLRALFNWAVLGGKLPSTPFKVGNVAAVKLVREEARTRRLQPGEGPRLLAHAGELRDLIIAALETGCRLGELLSLQWEQVRGDLFLPAGKTKAKKPRRVPISSVLRGVLEARRCDPAGDPLPGDAFVFGDAVGRPRRAIQRAWGNACTRAGIVGLHFHDLRREAGSTWMDLGVPLATIQRWLGHHNISQTSTYLAASGGGDADAMRAFEAARHAVTRGDAIAGPNTDQARQSPTVPSENIQSLPTVAIQPGVH
jgi:integrase